jgi:hypothetical protein
MVDVAKQLSASVDALGAATESFRSLLKQDRYSYVALRFTNMLIQARAFAHLENFLSAAPCRLEEDFLCGLYAQLEEAWACASATDQGEIATPH